MRRHDIPFACGLLVIVSMSRPLGAQTPLTVEAGVSAVRFPDEALTAIGPTIRVAAAAGRGPVSGSITGAALGTNGGATGSASLEARARSSSYDGWSADIGSELSSVLGTAAGGGAGTAIAGGRAIWASTNIGSWLRATASYSRREQKSLQGHGLDAGVWWASPRTQVSFAIAHEWTDGQLFTGPFRTGFVGTVPVRYTEGSLNVHAATDRATFDVSAGVRRDADAAREFDPAVTATAAFWTGDTRAIVFSVARTLPDFVRGADAADAVSVGMRFMQATPAADRVRRMIPVLLVSESAAGERVLRVRAPGARSVDIRGDFTDWKDVRLAPNGEVFERAIAVASGSHRVLVRIDGGEWKAAANTPGVDDDFGGRAGLLVVP